MGKFASSRKHFDDSDPDENFLRATTVRITGKSSGEFWARFARVHGNHPALKADVIYALPSALIDSICSDRDLKWFFSSDDLKFERDLAHCGGFFLKSPISLTSQIELTLKRLMIDPDPPKKLDKETSSIEKMKQDSAMDRWGYAGWLVTDSGFRSERDDFRSRWEPTVKELGHFPPRDPSCEQDGYRVKEPYREFYSAYLDLLNRWGLQEMPTWDTVVPLHPFYCGPGRDFIPNFAPAGFLFWEPCYRLREDKNRLNLIADLCLRQAVPDHLRGWLVERPSKWGPDRFARVWEIYLCFELALKARYADRIKGSIEPLDRSMAKFFCQGRPQGDNDARIYTGDSIKDARLMMNRRLQMSC